MGFVVNYDTCSFVCFEMLKPYKTYREKTATSCDYWQVRRWWVISSSPPLPPPLMTPDSLKDSEIQTEKSGWKKPFEYSAWN